MGVRLRSSSGNKLQLWEFREFLNWPLRYQNYLLAWSYPLRGEKMPIHLDDVNVISKITRQCSALIVPCYLCPAVTVAVRDQKPFLQLFSHFLKSPPFERYIKRLQSELIKNDRKILKYISAIYVLYFTLRNTILISGSYLLQDLQ